MFEAKSAPVLNRQNKVQRVSIPLTVTFNATPASKSFTTDGGIVYLQLEGIDNCTVASGALATGESMPAGMQTPTDSTGTIVCLVKIGEPISKVVSAKIIGRTATALLKNCKVEGPTTGTPGGQSVVVSCATGIVLSTTSLDAVLEVEYTI